MADNDATGPFITAIVKAAFAEDLSRLIVTFKTADGKHATYQFAPNILNEIVGKLSQLVTFVQSQTLSKGGHFVSHAADAVDATASPVADMNKLVLSVRMQNGVTCEFALEPTVATRLREELQQAEKKLQSRPSHSRY
jgi:hypothetical protein